MPTQKKSPKDKKPQGVVKKLADAECVEDDAPHYDNYVSYAQVLRTWLVAYGIGGPVLFLTNKDVAKSISDSGQAVFITGCFLAGVTLQILIALINKWVAWCTYAGICDPALQQKWIFKAADGIRQQVWLDVCADFFAIIALMWASWRVFMIFTA